MNYKGCPRKVIIDTDAGIDDVVALFMALAAHKNPKIPFEIIGITTVLGNTNVDNVCKNVFIVLDSAGVNNIPVYKGAANPLVQPFERGEPPIFGDDGLGGVQTSLDLPIVKQNRVLEKECAAMALVRLAQKYQGELTVIAVGPLTNLAIAVNIDPDFVGNVKELYIMGGNIHSIGNIRPCSEFNFFVDPESAFVVLGAAWNQHIVLIPWETCKQAMSPLEWRRQTLGTVKSKQMQLLNLIEEQVLVRNEQRYGKWISADAVCMAVLLNPDIISAINSNFCTVELLGSHTRGQMVVDHPRKSGKKHNVTIIEQVNLSMLEEILVSAFQESNFVH